MKSVFFALILVASVHSFAASTKGGGQIGSAESQNFDLRADDSFVENCPDTYLTYYDKSEGGPGPYCNCPDENITYIDKAEGGPGFICLEKE